MSETTAAKPKRPKPKSMIMLGEQTNALFENARLAKERGEKVGWSASIFPQEIAETLGLNILYPEKDTATGHNHFFCSNSGDQCDNDLPVSKTGRPKERDDCFPNIGSETQTDICYISGRTEI